MLVVCPVARLACAATALHQLLCRDLPAGRAPVSRCQNAPGVLHVRPRSHQRPRGTDGRWAATAAAVLAAEDVAGVAHALAHALAAHGAAPCSNAGEEDQGAGAERQPLETRTPPAAGQGQGTEAAGAHTMDHSRRSTPSDPALASAAAALEAARRAGAVSPLAHLSAAASWPVPVCIWNEELTEGFNC